MRNWGGVAIAHALMMALALVPTSGAVVPPVDECAPRSATYCVTITITDGSMGCVQNGTLWDCTLQATLRAVATPALPGPGTLTWHARSEFVACVDAGACGQGTLEEGGACSWSAGEGCVVEEVLSHTLTRAGGADACRYMDGFISARSDAGPLAVRGDANPLASETAQYETGVVAEGCVEP